MIQTFNGLTVRRMLAALMLTTALAGTAYLGGSSPAAAGGVTCAGETATMTGDGGSNEIDGTSGRDVIHARGGNDEIDGHGGNDLICGGSGRDELAGDAGNDRIRAGRGNDELDGNAGSDGLFGGPGSDDIDGGGGNDECAGEHVERC